MTSEFAPPKTNVTTTTYGSIYSYSAGRLWIAYGIAIFVSVVATLAGFLALWLNGASYSSDFSTIHRVGYSAVLSTSIQLGDVDGADPLPKHLGKAKFNLLELQLVPSAEQPMNYVEGYGDN